jgi:hypothetical protein
MVKKGSNKFIEFLKNSWRYTAADADSAFRIPGNDVFYYSLPGNACACYAFAFGAGV